MTSEGSPLIRKPRSLGKCVICVLVTLVVIVVALIAAIVLVTLLIRNSDNNDNDTHSRVGHYRHAAVATDNPECSRVGRRILQEKNGSVVDSAIATLLCLGLHDVCSCGLGGGSFYVIYDKPKHGSKKEVFALDARETAPGKATKSMLDNHLPNDPLTIAVPGAVSGYYEAWERFGKLPWEQLFKPAIHMAKNGFKVSWKLAHYIRLMKSSLQKSPYLRKVFLKPDGSLYQKGEYIKLPDLGRTLEIIARDGRKAFYNGSLAETIATELKNAGSIITKKDLTSYKPEWRDIVHMGIQGHDYYTMPPPSGGAALLFMLNILAGYNLTSAAVKTVDSAVLTYHRFTETMKFGFAKKSFLGDPAFVNVTKILENITSSEYADEIRRMINDARTYGPDYYGSDYILRDQGTSHFSILAPDGSAVAVTSTINTPFGSGVRGNVTGILYNNEMLDFSINHKKERYTPPPLNDIQPKKRPLSSMSPTIILNAESRDVVGIIGGSGGSHIPTGMLRVLTNKLWLGEDLGTADDAPRLHHSLIPDTLVVEEDITRPIIDGLRKKGHIVKVKHSIGNGIQAIWSSCRHHGRGGPENKCITAVSDKRLHGKPDGY